VNWGRDAAMAAKWASAAAGQLRCKRVGSGWRVWPDKE
jgi:hypothetical protein